MSSFVLVWFGDARLLVIELVGKKEEKKLCRQLQ